DGSHFMEGSIGARLRRARKQRQLSLDQVAEVTRLRLHYLQALENDDLSAMPSAAQARGFLRIYAGYLGLDIDELLENPERLGLPQQSSTEAGEAGVSDDGEPQRRRTNPLSVLRRRLPFDRLKAEDSADTVGTSEEDAAGGAGTVDGNPALAPTPEPVSAASDSQSLQQPPESPSLGLEPAPGTTPLEGPRGDAHPEASSPESGQAAASEERQEAAAPPHAEGGASWFSKLHVRSLFRRSADVSEDHPLPEPGSPASIEPDTWPTSRRDAKAPPDQPAEASESSGEIFADIGRRLRERRELLGLTEDEVERHSRVKASFVHSLELAEFENLPSPVQTRGILANYAGFLDLDVDETLLRFAEGLQARHREQRPDPQSARARPSLTVHTNVPPLRSFIASDLVFGLGVAILLALFAAWGITRVMATRSTAQADATSPSISDVLAGTALSTVAAEVTLIPAQDTPVAATDQVSTLEGTEAATLDPNVTLELSLATSERTYLRVTVDGEVMFDGRTVPGTEYSYQGANRIELLVGNASALRVTFNGRDLGLMGGFGEVVDRVYTAEGVSTPTSTPPPTPTPSPNITATPSITPTPTSSPSPTPTIGGQGVD
ncbi:MAG: RodZ domain-containing protein, partial [Anaerolineales bacterium]